jgi:hypothetical protein
MIMLTFFTPEPFTSPQNHPFKPLQNHLETHQLAFKTDTKHLQTPTKRYQKNQTGVKKRSFLFIWMNTLKTSSAHFSKPGFPAMIIYRQAAFRNNAPFDSTDNSK